MTDPIMNLTQSTSSFVSVHSRRRLRDPLTSPWSCRRHTVLPSGRTVWVPVSSRTVDDGTTTDWPPPTRVLPSWHLSRRWRGPRYLLPVLRRPVLYGQGRGSTGSIVSSSPVLASLCLRHELGPWHLTCTSKYLHSLRSSVLAGSARVSALVLTTFVHRYVYAHAPTRSPRASP